MEMKPHKKSLRRNPLSDVSYRNSGMMLNGQGPSRRPCVVKNEQGSSHLTRRMRRVSKLAEPSRLRVGTWNIWSFTGKLREIVDTMIRQRVNILYVQETK
jgi:hypothetical protein